MTPTAETLAHEFSEGLRRYLSPAQMREVVERNRLEMTLGVCHSHDFCDANMVLYEAFLRHGLDPLSDECSTKHNPL